MECPIQARSTYRHNILRVLPNHPRYQIGDKVYITSDPNIIHQEYRSEVPLSYTQKQVNFIASNYAGRYGEIKAISQWKWFLIGVKGAQPLEDEWFPPFALLLLKMVPEKAHLPYFNIPNLNVIIHPVPETFAKFPAHAKLNALALCGREAVVVQGPGDGEHLTVELLNDVSNSGFGGQQYSIHYTCCYYARRNNLLPPPSFKSNSLLLPTSRTPQLAHIALSKVLRGDALERDALYAELVKRGWAVVILDKQMAESVQRTVEPLQYFFSRPEEYKSAFNLAHVFGYTHVGHKESFRWLTGHRMNKAMLPSNLTDNLTSLTQLFDRTMTQLIDKISLDFWGVPPDKLGDYCDLPILQTARAQQDPFHQRWAMMDVAHYFNDQEVFDKVASKKLPQNINCDSHCDPGLLSLSVLSTAPGLELFDFASNQWYRFDNSHNLFGQLGASEASANLGREMAILWTGKAAHFANTLMPPCIHRVTREIGTARLAMWYEICTAAQEPSINSTLDNGTVTKEKAKPANDNIDVSEFIKLAVECSGAKYAQSTPSSNQQHPPLPNPAPTPFRSSPTLISHEMGSGIPMTKSLVPTLPPPVSFPLQPQVFAHELHTGIPPSKSGPRPSPQQFQKQFLANELHSGIPMSKTMWIPPPIDRPPNRKELAHNNSNSNTTKANRKSAPSQLEDLAMDVEQTRPTYSRVAPPSKKNSNMLSSEGRTGIPISKSGMPRPNKKAEMKSKFLAHEDDTGIPMTKDDSF